MTLCVVSFKFIVVAITLGYRGQRIPSHAKIQELIMVKTIHSESNGSAGARTISTIAEQRGLSISRYRVGRMMKKLGLESSQPPSHNYKKTEQPHLEIPNTLNRAFDVKQPRSGVAM